MKKNIKKINELCDIFNGTDQEFSRIVSEACQAKSGLEQKLVIEFEISSSTVIKWIKGTVMPLPRMQKEIVQFIAKQFF